MSQSDAEEFAYHQERVIQDMKVALSEARRLNAELLEALETLAAEEHRDDYDPILITAREKARAAIAKAKP